MVTRVVLPTAAVPFCAGVAVSDGEMLLMALGDVERWEIDGELTRIPITGVGGGPEPGEALTACALREAREELGVDVELLSAAECFVEDVDGVIAPRGVDGTPTPLLIQHQRRTDPSPWAPGLPPGDVLTVVMFRARALGVPRPADVPGLVTVPLGSLGAFASPVPVRDLDRLGVTLDAHVAIPDQASLAFARPSTESLLVTTLATYGSRRVFG